VARFCGNCGASLRETNTFCGQCGTKIQASSARARELSATQLGVLIIALLAVVAGAYRMVAAHNDAPLALSTRAPVVSPSPSLTRHQTSAATAEPSSVAQNNSLGVENLPKQELRSETFGKMKVQIDGVSSEIVSFSIDDSVNDGQCNDEVSSIVEVVYFRSIGDGGSFDLVINDPKWGEEAFSEVDIAAMPPEYRTMTYALFVPGTKIRIRSRGCGSGAVGYLTGVARL